MIGRTTAAADYRIVDEGTGSRFIFYCGVSGARICSTGVIEAETPEKQLELAWSKEGRKHFNRCHKCGRWVCDSMYNPDMLGCVQCYPVIGFQRYCMVCGCRVRSYQTHCGRCGADIRLGIRRGWKDRRDVLHIRNLRHYGFGSDAMMNLKVCPSCKGITGASRSTCPTCGAPLGEDTLYQHYNSISRHCHVCAAIVTQDAEYCPQCGKKLTD